MTTDKLKNQLLNLHKFIQIYCDENHNIDRVNGFLDIQIEDENIQIPYHLCPKCKHILLYSNEKLKKCIQNKNRCKKCNYKCYEHDELKYFSKIKKTVDFKLKLDKIKNKLCSILKITRSEYA